MRVWICGECRLTSSGKFDIVRISEIVPGSLFRTADGSWCVKASSRRRIAADLSENIRKGADVKVVYSCKEVREKSWAGDLPERRRSMAVNKKGYGLRKAWTVTANWSKAVGMIRNSWLFTWIILWLTGTEHLFAYGTPLSWTWSMWRNMRIEKSVIIGYPGARKRLRGRILEEEYE